MARAPSAKRYAQAAFQIALERGELEQWLEELQRVHEALHDDTLRAYLGQPQVRLDLKLQVIATALKENHPLVRNLVGLLTSRSSLELMPGIVEEYQRFLDIHQHRERGEVVSAVPLEPQQQDRVTKLLEGLVHKEVVLEPRVDTQIIGGIKARVGDKVVDGSTRTRLEEMRRKLVEEVPV